VLAAALLGLGAPAALRAENIDPASNGSQYAYCENVGWINAEPSGDGGPGVLVGDAELGGWMWAENIGWISLSCENTFSCAAISYGVSNDGAGVLSGYAWGENVGWINFAPSTAGVSIDPATGDWSGRAWGENIGWITFASAGGSPFKVTTGWQCVPLPLPPSGSPALTFGKLAAGTLLTWDSITGATGFDIVRGDLGCLRSSGGDFTACTQACLDNDRATVSFLFSAAPAAAAGFWFLVRGVNCGGAGTYDSGDPSQIGSRDAEINASVPSCP
jgi:hypothetical protein